MGRTDKKGTKAPNPLADMFNIQVEFPKFKIYNEVVNVKHHHHI